MKTIVTNVFVSAIIILALLTSARESLAQENQGNGEPVKRAPEVLPNTGADKFLAMLSRSSRARARANAAPCGVSHPMFQFYGPDLDFLFNADPENAGKILVLQGELMVSMGEVLIKQGEAMLGNE